MNRFPAITENVLLRFTLYFLKQDSNFGLFHLVLCNSNVDDCHVIFCLVQARIKQDLEAVWLAKHLLLMSKTQRMKLPYRIYRKSLDL